MSTDAPDTPMLSTLTTTTAVDPGHVPPCVELRSLETRLGRAIDRWRDHLGGLVLRTAAELKASIAPVEADLRILKLDVGEALSRLRQLEQDVERGRDTLSDLKVDQSDVQAEVRAFQRRVWKHRATGGVAGLLVGALPVIVELIQRWVESGH